MGCVCSKTEPPTSPMSRTRHPPSEPTAKAGEAFSPFAREDNETS